MNPLDKIKLLEILFVILTGAGKFIFMDWLDWRFFYISSASISWMLYIAYKYRKNKNILEYWGLSRKGFKKTFLELLPFALICVCIFILIGDQMNTSILNKNIIPLLIIYPIWGIIQQFIIIGIIAKNLKEMSFINLSTTVIITITAIFFSIVHFPFLILVLATFLLAIIYTFLYLKNRNLIVLGIYHGWVGAFFFYTILSRDPWNEVFGVTIF